MLNDNFDNLFEPLTSIPDLTRVLRKAANIPQKVNSQLQNVDGSRFFFTSSQNFLTEWLRLLQKHSLGSVFWIPLLSDLILLDVDHSIWPRKDHWTIDRCFEIQRPISVQFFALKEQLDVTV